DPDLFKPLDVIQHRNRYLVFEGQHRLSAARIALGEDQRVPCHIHAEAPLEQQARMALGSRNSLRWTKIEEWGVRVIAREEIPVKIEAILHRHNLRVDLNPTTPGTVHAVGALEQSYKRYGGEGTLDRTLAILGAAWGLDVHAYEGTLILG